MTNTLLKMSGDRKTKDARDTSDSVSVRGKEEAKDSPSQFWDLGSGRLSLHVSASAMTSGLGAQSHNLRGNFLVFFLC